VGIQPIDLQTLYSQLDKVGKEQVHQQLASQVIQDAQIKENKILAEQKRRKVQEADAGDEKSGTVHEKRETDRNRGTGTGDTSGKKKEENELSEKDKKTEIIKDPALGTHIDISG
jgi:hypothetical protein